MHHIIFNPAAGRGRNTELPARLAGLFNASGLRCKTLTTAAPLEARAFAREVCLGKYGDSSGIIGVGGDGTLQETVAGMADAYKGLAAFPLPLGILPCGSGNDFALTKDGGKAKPSIEELVNSVKNKKTRPVDLITETESGDAFINIANMGLDARIVANAEPLRKTFGSNAYIAAALKSIARHKDMPGTVKVNGKVLREPLALIAVCNGQYYGGGLRIAPSAAIDDGKITLVTVKAMSRPRLLALFPSILFEKHTRLKEVRTLTCAEVSVYWEGTRTLCLDGNLFEREGCAHFKILPGALRMYG